MTASGKSNRPNLLARTALGLALALGVTVGSFALSTPAMAAKKDKGPSLKFSKGFQTAAAPADKAIGEAPKRDDVIAATAAVAQAEQNQQNARGKAAKEQADAALASAKSALAGTLASERQLLDTAVAATENEDDRFMAGNLLLKYGGLAKDIGIQRDGLKMMIESGKTAEADVPKFSFYVGQFSYLLGDYSTSASYLQRAVDAGFHENNADILLVEALNSGGQVQQALAALRKSVDLVEASGTSAPEQWYARGYQIAYRAKLGQETVDWSAETAKRYPTPFNWLGALQLAREFSDYKSHESLDLGRLMQRSGALDYDANAVGREYIEFIQAGVKWRLWPEVTAAINEGVAKGAISAGDPFVKDSAAQAKSGGAQDAADLAAAIRNAPGAANGLEALGAGDLLLAKGDAAKAVTYYQMAIQKGGIDTDRALTRLGIAQMDAGQFEDAKASFSQVAGIRSSLGKLGAILAGQKQAAAGQ